MKFKSKFLILSGLGAALLVGCSDTETKDGKELTDRQSDLSQETVSNQEVVELNNIRNGLLEFVWDYNRYGSYDFENTTVVLNGKLLTEEDRTQEMKRFYQRLSNLRAIDEEKLQNYQASLKDVAIQLNEKKLELIELEPKVFKDGGYGLMLKAEPSEKDLTRYKELLNEITKIIDAEKENILRLEIAIVNTFDISEEDVKDFIEYKKMIPTQLKDKYSLHSEDIWNITRKPMLPPEKYADLLAYTSDVKAILEDKLDNKYAKKDYEFISQLKTIEEYENILSEYKNNLNEDTFNDYYKASLSIHNYLVAKDAFLLTDLDLTTYYEVSNYEGQFYSLKLF
ncbi:hypothetical protein [Lysinibacillus xylanilyticus]|uniref:hypothetical protein n=1 Tax=Lysinibacillus xylanilyticus TaxID=582475 RepID=UPI00380E1F35